MDSVITAVRKANEITIMVTVVILAVGVMMFSAGPISNFVDRHPTVKVLALSFFLLISIALIGDGLDMQIPMGISILLWASQCLWKWSTYGSGEWPHPFTCMSRT